MIIFQTKLTVIFSGKCGYFDVAVISVSVKGFSAPAVSSQEPILGLFTLFQKRLCCLALLDRAAPSHSLPCSRSQAAPALMHTPGRQETHVQLITKSTIVDHGLTGCTLDQMNCPHNIHRSIGFLWRLPGCDSCSSTPRFLDLAKGLPKMCLNNGFFFLKKSGMKGRPRMQLWRDGSPQGLHFL